MKNSNKKVKNFNNEVEQNLSKKAVRKSYKEFRTLRKMGKRAIYND